MLITLATIAPKRLIRLTIITNTEVFPKYIKLGFCSEFTSAYTTCQPEIKENGSYIIVANKILEHYAVWLLIY